MKKPSGTLEYAIAAIAGGGIVTVDTFATDDTHGNHFGAPISDQCLIQATFVPTAQAGAIANNVVTNKTPTTAAGLLTALSVSSKNNNANAGDTVTGILYVTIWNNANAGV